MKVARQLTCPRCRTTVFQLLENTVGSLYWKCTGCNKMLPILFQPETEKYMQKVDD